MNKKSILLSMVTLAACAAGCGIEPETLQSLREVVNTVSAAGPATQGELAESALDKPAFDPPHPDRVDPFSFPAGAPIEDKAGTTITTVAQVDVMGFAQVDEPRVLLRTKETTKSLKVGEMTDGVEVVAINPPTVELRMGTLVWTANMFENTSLGKK